MATSYAGILTAIVTLLKADSGVTALLASRTIGATTSGANNIFYGAGDLPLPVLFPCIAVRDLGVFPLYADQHDVPMAAVLVPVEVSCFGQSQDLRGLLSELDEAFEGVHNSNAIDTADWRFLDVDTSGDWNVIQVPKELTADGSLILEQRVKVYGIKAANKNI